MKRNKYLVYFGGAALAIGALFASCEKEDKLGESVLNVTPGEKSDLDRWLDTEFRDAYNIRVFYRWDPYKVDLERYLNPPSEEKVRPALEVVKGIWIDTYTKVAGEFFIKKIAPREIVLVGSRNMNTNGTVTLGMAEQGYRITLFDVDILKLDNREAVKQYIHTIQHEYVHILNQTTNFDVEGYTKITGGDYRADWNGVSDAEALRKGFISSYSMKDAKEDFAEQASWMLRDIQEYETRVNNVSAEGRAKIRQKEAIVVEYYKTAFGIDFYELCRVAREKTYEIVESNQ